MSTSQHSNPSPSYTKLELRTAYGPVYRDVLTLPPRECHADEIPVIDLSPIYSSSLSSRQHLAAEIRNAAENTGFFYIKNHGVPETAIQNCLQAAKTFFDQPQEMKLKVSKDQAKHFNGFSASRTAMASPGEGLDHRESFMWRYEPQYDPDSKDVNEVPDEVKAYIRGEEFVWTETSHIPQFKEHCLTYWQECLKLARRLVRLFALCLDLPEDYFDSVTTYPGSDGVFNFYPALTEEQIRNTETSNDIGLGSHTDLQCFTLLWQDMQGGLQVLNRDGQWIKASPIEGTFVVNIGDYLMRLSNDRFQSTVHRVFNRASVDRYSMPFFFGFNLNEECGVLPSCIDENHPAKYKPISCGDWCDLRFKQTDLKSNVTAY